MEVYLSGDPCSRPNEPHLFVRVQVSALNPLGAVKAQEIPGA